MPTNSPTGPGVARHYDDLDPDEQAAKRAEWSQRITELREGLDLVAMFEAEGRPYAVLDDDGNVVIHGDVTEEAG